MDIQCVCPRQHPDGDRIELRETLDFRAVTTIRNAVRVLRHEDPDTGTPEILALLTEYYVLLGIKNWTLQDEKGKPIEVSRSAIREYVLSRVDIAADIGDAADDLYAEKVMLPLFQRGQNSSPPTPTGVGTSATKESSKTRKSPSKPSRQSSITTIPMAGTETITTSLDGGSNTSQSSTSAA